MKERTFGTKGIALFSCALLTIIGTDGWLQLVQVRRVL